MSSDTTKSLAAAQERMELYFIAHPGTPSAVRQPRLLKKAGVWVVQLGEDGDEMIMGAGVTVEEALRNFDASYLNFLRAPDAADQFEHLLSQGQQAA